MNCLLKWLLQILQIIFLILAGSIIIDSNGRGLAKNGFVCAFAIVILKQSLYLFVLSGEIFANFSFTLPCFPILYIFLDSVFYLIIIFVLQSLYLSESISSKSYKALLATILATLLTYIVIYSQWTNTISNGTSNFTQSIGYQMIQVLHVLLVCAILYYLYKKKKTPLLLNWQKLAFLLFLLTHIFFFIANHHSFCNNLAHILQFCGYFALAASELKNSLLAKAIFIFLIVVIVPGILCVSILSHEINNNLIFTGLSSQSNNSVYVYFSKLGRL